MELFLELELCQLKVEMELVEPFVGPALFLPSVVMQLWEPFLELVLFRPLVEMELVELLLELAHGQL